MHGARTLGVLYKCCSRAVNQYECLGHSDVRTQAVQVAALGLKGPLMVLGKGYLRSFPDPLRSRAGTSV